MIALRILTIAVGIGLIGCARHHVVYRPGPDRVHEHDTATIAQPAAVDPVLAWQSIDNTFWRQGEELTDLDRSFRKLVGRPKESYNITRFDGVANSSWFTNRLGTSPMTAAEITRGAGSGSGPDTSQPWLVFRPKVQGATPGFWIKDSRGEQYIIKFDPPSAPELATGAAAMGARFFYACGYNVPEETIVHWRPENLQIQTGVMFTDREGVKREFTRQDLDDILARVAHQPDGRIRSLASKVLAGKVVGPFSYDGRRKDDPNDWCPHEHRRELRGLYVIASFVNHYDTKDQNTLDLYVNDGGRNYLKHYLIDFGSTFGANGDRPKGPRQGYANIFDLRDVVVSWLTFGLKKWGWEDAKPAQHASIGYFESEIFAPNKFDPIVPNSAFENLTDRDGYWGAKIVMEWSDDRLAALVKTGEYSDPAAADYLLQTLIARREKIGRYWFSKVSPLEDFEIVTDAKGIRIVFVDLAADHGWTPARADKYRWSLRHDGKSIADGDAASASVILAASALANIKSRFTIGAQTAAPKPLEFKISSRHSEGGWSKSARVWLWYHADRNEFEIVGIEH